MPAFQTGELPPDPLREPPGVLVARVEGELSGLAAGVLALAGLARRRLRAAA